MRTADLLVVGAGAKAAALAAKVDAMNRLGLAALEVTIVEKTEPAASWLGRNGMTSGEEPLAVPPIKDVGFPYRSARQFGVAGREIDAALGSLGWPRYAIERELWAPWVNSGAPPVRHRDFGAYLTWVLERATAGVTIVAGRVVAIEIGSDPARWEVELDPAGRDERRRVAGRALVLTGPGVHRAFPHDPATEPRVFHCDSRREEFDRIPSDAEVEIAIVGGGESALSALAFLRALRPRARFVVFTPNLPLSRGESFLENRVFADPDDVGWEALDPETRRDFVKHCDRGVFDAGGLARIAGAERCSFVTGRATGVGDGEGGKLELSYESAAGPATAATDFVVNCTGFDLLAQLRGLFAEPVRAELEARCGPIWDRPPGAELRFGRALELAGSEPRLHIPGLAGLSQGPGFANLGSLGLLANRVLEPLLPDLTAEAPVRRGVAARGRSAAGLVAALALVLLTLALGGCGGSSASGGASSTGGAETGARETGKKTSIESAGSAYPGVDLANTRYVEGPIDAGTVASLRPAWSLPLTAKSSYGAFSSTPVVSEGVAYLQDLVSDVRAVDVATGKVLWTHEWAEPDQGPNGVVVGAGMVYGATPRYAFALDAATGEEVWRRRLTRSAGEAIDMAPGLHGGLVYVSTVPTDLTSQYHGGVDAILWALDAKTGEPAWHFDTGPRESWSKSGAKINSGGGLWYAPSFDEEGSIYFGTGNPVPFPGTAGQPWGQSRPGPNLYTDSLVKLDARTGKLDWYYQQTPHDLYDWDFQDPPILARAGGRDLAIGAGKSGVVVALDAATGKPVWKAPVGIHNGHDDDNLLALRGEYGKLASGASVYPGTLGGVIAPMAASSTTLFVPVVDHPLTIESGSALGEGEEFKGEMVALDLASGRELWKRRYPAPAFGAPTAVDGAVLFATFEGTVRALDAKTGDELFSAQLPAGANSGLAVAGDTVLVPAGIAVAEGQAPELAAFRIGG